MIYYVTKAGESRISELAEILDVEIVDYKDLAEALKIGLQSLPDSSDFSGDFMNAVCEEKKSAEKITRTLNILDDAKKFYILRNIKFDSRIDYLLSEQKRCLIMHYQLSNNFSSSLPNIIINDILEFGELMNANKFKISDVMKNDLRNLFIYWDDPSCLNTFLMNIKSKYMADIPRIVRNEKLAHPINYIAQYMNNMYRTNLLEATGYLKVTDPDEIEVSLISDNLEDKYRIPFVPSLKHAGNKLRPNPFFERYRCLCGHLKGKCREGEICNRCVSVVSYNDDLPIEYNNNSIPTSSESNTVLEQLKYLKKRTVSNIYVEQTSNAKYYINDDGCCVALKNFGNVKAGDIGGKVRSYENLSQQGLCWVYPRSVVAGKAVVSGNVRVIHSEIYGLAKITGNTTLFDSKVGGCTRIIGNSVINNSYLSIPTKDSLRDVVIIDSSIRTSVPAGAMIKNRNEIK